MNFKQWLLNEKRKLDGKEEAMISLPEYDCSNIQEEVCELTSRDLDIETALKLWEQFEQNTSKK